MFATKGRMKMTTTTNRKKGRLRLVLLAAAALGSSSATMSGVLASLATQHTLGGPTSVA